VPLHKKDQHNHWAAISIQFRKIQVVWPSSVSRSRGRGDWILQTDL